MLIDKLLNDGENVLSINSFIVDNADALASLVTSSRDSVLTVEVIRPAQDDQPEQSVGWFKAERDSLATPETFQASHIICYSTEQAAFREVIQAALTAEAEAAADKAE